MAKKTYISPVTYQDNYDLSLELFCCSPVCNCDFCMCDDCDGIGDVGDDDGKTQARYRANYETMATQEQFGSLW